MRSRHTRNRSSASRSYDELVRKTVPNPDSSWRPSHAQERRAYEGARLDPDEQALSGDIHEALLFEGISTATLTIEVDHDRVVLRGTVHDQKSADRILAIIERVDGVSSVIDQLTVTGW